MKVKICDICKELPDPAKVPLRVLKISWRHNSNFIKEKHDICTTCETKMYQWIRENKSY